MKDEEVINCIAKENIVKMWRVKKWVSDKFIITPIQNIAKFGDNNLW